TCMSESPAGGRQVIRLRLSRARVNPVDKSLRSSAHFVLLAHHEQRCKTPQDIATRKRARSHKSVVHHALGTLKHARSHTASDSGAVLVEALASVRQSLPAFTHSLHSVLQSRTHHGFIEITGPLAHDERRHSVADQVRE